MATQVWVSTAAAPGRNGLGPEWREAGEIDQARERELWRVIQGHLGSRSASRLRRLQFYADLDPDSPGFQDLAQLAPTLVAGAVSAADFRARFWLALRWSGPPPRVFFSSRPARFTILTRRPPERHPGMRRVLRPIGVQLDAGDDGIFKPLVMPEL